ncbi:TetR/AcrR family transcriptional regulator [Kribbella sp. NPDC055071]
MSAPTQRPGGRSARVRQQVLEATAKILLDGGLDAATIPAIAERSGVHHTSIYRRWQDRGTLIRDAILNTSDTVVPVPDTGHVRSDLIELFEGVAALLGSPFGAVLMDVVRSRDAALVELRDNYWDARLDRCATVISRAVDRGELPPGSDHRLIFELIVGPLHGRFLLGGNNRDTTKVPVIVDAVLYGVANGK